MVSGLSVGLLCPTREQTHLPLEKIHERARAPAVPCHRRRGTLCILLRIMFFSTLIRSLNGHWVGQNKQPTCLLRALGTTHLLLPGLCGWGRGAALPAELNTELLQTVPLTNLYLLSPLQLPWQPDKFLGFVKKKKKKVKIKAERASITGPTVKLLESSTSSSLPSHGHKTRAERAHGLQPSGTPRIHRWLIGLLLLCSAES